MKDGFIKIFLICVNVILLTFFLAYINPSKKGNIDQPNPIDIPIDNNISNIFIKNTETDYSNINETLTVNFTNDIVDNYSNHYKISIKEGSSLEDFNIDKENYKSLVESYNLDEGVIVSNIIEEDGNYEFDILRNYYFPLSSFAEIIIQGYDRTSSINDLINNGYICINC